MADPDRLGGYAPGEDKYEDTKYMLQASYDYFDYFWRGEGRRWKQPDRRPHFTTLPVPKTRIRPPRPSRPGREQPVPKYSRFEKLALRQERPGATAEVEGQIEQGYFPVKAALDPLDISISKILGWGGQAVAVLVELLGEDGGREKVVVKCQKPDRNNLASEIAHMDRLYGARHIIGKREYVPRRFRNPQNESDRASAIQAGVLSADGERLTRNDIFAMELMPHGSLENLLKKASRNKTHFRNGELWKIFQCLLKACIALAYPDSWRGGNIQDETIPRSDDGSPLRIENAIIHFDISTDNIFIGDFDSTPGPLGHDTVPIVKARPRKSPYCMIGDLGLAESFSQADRADMFTMVGRRRVGKSVCFTPEQFTDDWNHLTNAPISEGEDTAANFDWWTNVYGIGLIMWQLITQTLTEMPPQPTLLRPPGTADDSVVWTYGGMLRNPEFDHYDPQLKFLVMWCLVDQPSMRPSLTAAQERISTALARDWMALGDGHPRRKSIESFFRDPPPAPAPARDILDQSIPGDLGLQTPMQPGGPAPNPSAPAQGVPDPVGPAPIPVEVYAGPNGFFTRVGDAGGVLHELEVHKVDAQSFVVLRDNRVYVVDVGAADPSARGSPATPIPVSTHAGQDGRALYVTAWRPGFAVDELVVHTDMTNNTHYVEFDGRRTSILDMAGIPPQQA